MPGRGSYGPGGKFIHDRAARIMAEGKIEEKYGPEKGKQIAYALATQQAHKLGKTPARGNGPHGTYGTVQGKKKAMAKFNGSKKDYRKTASMEGQDLRGEKGKFPTDDSKGPAYNLLHESQAEVGPSPSESSLAAQGPTVRDIVATSPGTTKGSLPKIGSLDTEIADQDELLRYFWGHPEELQVEEVPDSWGRSLERRKDELAELFENGEGREYTYRKHEER